MLQLRMLLLLHALSVSSLVYIATCTIYNVTPDDTTCHHCHNLQHYLFNATKYFTSNTQLLFLPGLHHLHTDLIIQNVHNISLIGSTTNGTTPDTVIQCKSSVGIVMNNITSLTVKNLALKKCLTKYRSMKPAILITGCSFVKLYFMHIERAKNQPSLVGVNILGRSTFTNITSYSIHLYYYDSKMMNVNHTISIKRFSLIPNTGGKYGSYVSMKQYSYAVTLELSNTTIKYLKRTNFLYVTSEKKTNNSSKVVIKDCDFNNTVKRFQLWLIKLFYVMNINTYMEHCTFSNNTGFIGVITAVNSKVLSIDHCTFHSNCVSIFGRNDQGLVKLQEMF